MKNLLFQELALVSLRDRAGWRVAFHPKATVIKGENDTGKSCLMKSIYRTLGAEPPNIHSKWEESIVRSVLRFTLDGMPYSMLRDESRLTLFRGNGEKLRSFHSITKDVAPHFAEMFGFRLPLKTHQATNIQATPAFLFLPFYVDQDKSWANQLASFDKLSQFSNWRSDVLYYHLGIRPSEYYRAKADLSQAERDIDDLKSQRKALADIQTGVRERLSRIRFDIDTNAFQAEVKNLVKQCNTLKKKEDRLRSKIVDLSAERVVLEKQLAVASASGKRLGLQYATSLADVSEELECPTCGAVYENSFAERLSIACDEHRCREFALECKGHLADIDAELNTRKADAEEIEANAAKIHDLLAARRGSVRLRDLIENAGKKELASILEGDIAGLDGQVEARRSELREHKEAVKLYTDKGRRNEIQQTYVDLMARFLHQLDVRNLPQPGYEKIDSRIRESGSDQPRALLAYYFSLLHTARKYSTSTYCPIVVDSPHAQDLDEINRKRVVDFIRANQPQDSQLILGLVDDYGCDFGGDVITLTDKWHLLRESEYETAMDMVGPLLEQSLAD